MARYARGTMTTAEYLDALERLGLSRTSQKTVEALGVTTRSLTLYANGHPIPRTVQIILTLMLTRWREYGEHSQSHNADTSKGMNDRQPQSK